MSLAFNTYFQWKKIHVLTQQFTCCNKSACFMALILLMLELFKLCNGQKMYTSLQQLNSPNNKDTDKKQMHSHSDGGKAT